MENVWETTNGGAAWFAISPFSDGLVCNKITVSVTNPACIYVIREGYLWRTINGGSNWQPVTLPTAGAAAAVTLSASDPNKVWLAQNDSTANKVYASTNGGTNWSAYTGSLPNRAVDCIIYGGGSNDGLYLGTDAGIYYHHAAMSD